MICINANRRASAALISQLDRLVVDSSSPCVDGRRANHATVTAPKTVAGVNELSISYMDGVITLDLLIGTGDQVEDPAARDLFKEEVSTSTVKSVLLSSVALGSASHIAAFRNAINVNISFNSISDVSSLASLQHLRYLDLSHNKISDLRPLGGLVGLEVIRCHENNIATLEFMEKMINLRELCISHNLIEWENLIYFHGAVELRSLVWYGNPFETKANYLDFGLSFLSKLELLDGVPVTLQVWNPGFLGSSDGRVMLTQSKALLSKAGREKFAESKLNTTIGNTNDNMKYKIKPKILRAANLNGTRRPKRKDDVDASMLRSFDTDSVDALNVQTSTSIADHNDMANQHSSMKSAPIAFTKSLLSTEAPPRLGIVKASSGVGGQAKGPGLKAEVTASEAKVDAKNRDALMNPSSQNGVGAGCSIEGSKEATSLRFGNGNSPVAVCIYASGGGYVRWAPSGTIACSYEPGGQLFCAHKSSTASMAVVVAADGSGSVMDENGACLLSISKDRKVVLFDVSGSKMCEISTMVARQIPPPVSSTQGTEARDSIDDKFMGKIIISYETGVYRIGDEDCRAKFAEDAVDSMKFCKTYLLHWVFRSLEIYYDLDSLEMRVIINNGRAECVFSNSLGASITKVFPTKAELRESMRKSRPSERVGGGVVSDTPIRQKGAAGTVASALDESRDNSRAVTDALLIEASAEPLKPVGRDVVSYERSPSLSTGQPVVKLGSSAARKAAQGMKRGKTDSGDDPPVELLSAEEHERLRSGLASIMSEMNSIIQAARK